MSLTLDHAARIVDAALAKGRAMSLQPLVVVVLDAGGHLKALKREDGAGILRADVAIGKAWGALGMNAPSSRALGQRLQDRPSFLAALGMLADGKVVGVAGGLTIYEGDEVVGAVGISGATSDEDEECALAGIQAAGLTARV
ncbi:MAG TPA: heme-binding protein [Chloroflexota bacterium]|jgi:uncharacterized protein GlcG (DUF336 family)